MPVPDSIKKINNFVWEIPITYKKGMQVPARIYASKKLLGEMDDGVFEQITNVASMPGIQKYAFAMPDAHWGYGTPIGGVVAFDAEDGVISPGLVGFDINCLVPSTVVNLENGTWLTIKDLEQFWNKLKISFLNSDSKIKKETNMLALMKRIEPKQIYKISTKSGRTIETTDDHPLLTENGMVAAFNLRTNDKLIVNGFIGQKYEQPSSQTILSKEDLEKVLLQFNKGLEGNSKGQILKQLESRGLLPLRYDSPHLPILLKLAGFIFGDGCISSNNKNLQIGFYGKSEDLDGIRLDLERLGFKTSTINKRIRHHIIPREKYTSDFIFEECSIHKCSNALACLLIALGTPYGRKTEKKYNIPEWIMNAKSWQKRLFLAAFFGAELSTPSTIKTNKYTFYEPQLNMNKSRKLEENAINFLNQLRQLLNEFGIETREPVYVPGNNYKGKISDTLGFRLQINGNSKNLIHFYETIGYEYNLNKQRLASLAANYLRMKENIISKRNKAREKAQDLYRGGLSEKQVIMQLSGVYHNKNFIHHALHDRQQSLARVSFDFCSFNYYAQKYAYGNFGFAFDEIESIEILPYSGEVYDLTIDDDNHNFIANNLVVSNCGMRMLTTNLTLEELQPKLKELVDTLFKSVPVGVGCKGIVKLDKKQLGEIMVKGAEWCIENGYGWKEDLELTESNGCIQGADISKISDRAITRGIDQLGTLGSGNHYLEIQVVKDENIFDKDTAKKFGITKKNQICVMLHCGSRGFGHQVASDYLKVFEDAMKKYNIIVNDRELACAPFNSTEGQDYYKAMACAANMAFANRQVILHRIRECFSKVFGKSAEELGMHQVYDVAHNIVKMEEHEIDGKKKMLLVHRKGATRSYGPEFKELPAKYKKIGQPVIIGGSMETGSYLLVGTEKAKETFNSTAHGSGRTMSRTKAKHEVVGEKLQKEMEAKGIYVKSVSFAGLAEEAGIAYKDINEVIDTIDKAGISKRIAKLIPLGNIKG